MKQGIERKGRSLVEKQAALAPGDLFRSNRKAEFCRVCTQTDRWRLIDGLYKAFKIRWKLMFNPFHERQWQYFGSLFDDILSFLVIFACKII